MATTQHPASRLSFRQGDVFLIASAIPADTKPVPREGGSVVLAHGKVTNHRHHIPSKHAELVAHASGARYLRVVGEPVDLVHDEHDTIALPPGEYAVAIQCEYHPEAIRVVED